MSTELRAGNVSFDPAHVTYKLLDLDDFPSSVSSGKSKNKNKMKSRIAPVLSVRFVVRLSGNLTAHTSDSGLEQIPLSSAFLFVCLLDICFMFALCKSMCLEDCKTTCYFK